MNTLKIEGEGGSSTIYLNSSISNVKDLIGGRRTVIITDENLFRLHSASFPNAAEIIVVPAGEASKSLKSAGDVFRRLVDAELDRDSLVLGIGGGVVTDLAGFVACTFMRGISFGFVATTVLGQVDAAIGGKNGVNLDGFKNLIGIIRQPEFVLNDTAMLDTLPNEEIINGTSEIIKSGLIADLSLFEMMESAAAAESPYDVLDMGKAASMAAAVKVGVVNRDVFEHGERRHLNLGHTLGHAVEKIARLPHGYAVAVGMVAAAEISQARHMISADDVSRIRKVITAFGLPSFIDIDLKKSMDAIRKDKKRQSDKVNFVLLKALGEATVIPIAFEELEEALRDLR
ncbi:MAG: 3-dehydroquinate synthase [Deltaproteobacteria bacterium]|nr:3-dehydroquinate synthase [Deltaproteobacteria bacterium]